MRLMHNMASLSAFREQQKTEAKRSDALGKISSGYKVNSAKDDPNAIAESERLRMQIRGLQMGAKNAQDAVSMLQTGEGGMESIGNMIQRVKELAVKGADGTLTTNDKQIILDEMGQMVQGINDATNHTQFNGISLLNDGTTQPASGKITVSVGANVGESADISTHNFLSSNLGEVDAAGNLIVGKKLSDISTDMNLLTSGETIKIADAALTTVLNARADYGALENRFEGSMNASTEFADGMQSSESIIRDADIAEEMMQYTKSDILSQAGNSILVQTNKMPQDVLSILAGLKSR